MLSKSVRATFTALFLSTSATAALLLVPAAVAAEHLSKGVQSALAESQKLNQAGDMQGALAKVKEAQAVPDRTPHDDFVINQFLGGISANLKDYATAATAYDAVLASPEFAALTDAEKKATLHDAIIVSSNAQHWQNAITYSQRLSAMQALDDGLLALTAIAYYNLKDSAHAKEFAQKSIDAAKAAGKQPDQGALEIIQNAEAKSNPAAAELALENVVLQSSNPDDWDRLIEYNLSMKGMNDVFAMDLYRLKQVTHSLKTADATIVGPLANQLRYYGDAVAILQSTGGGGAALSSARANAAKEQGSINAEISAAGKGNATAALNVAEALYGYGRFADAEQLARAAAAKGGGKYPGQAQILVGMSLVGQGKYADAVQAFNAVNGGPAASKTAKLWSIYAQHQAGGAH